MFRRDFSNFVGLSAPLNAKLTKLSLSRLDRLSDAEAASFDVLQVRLVSLPILAVPRTVGNYTVDTDACDQQVVRVLLQKAPD